MPEFKGWICDTCGEIIQGKEDGWVEWIEFPEGGHSFQEYIESQRKGGDIKLRGRNLRLVHHYPASHRTSKYRCQFDQDYERRKDGGEVGDSSLESFLGPDGLMRFLDFIAENRFPNVQEVLEMIKRLLIPGYEHARLHFDSAISEGVIEPNPFKNYSQSEIDAVLDYVSSRG